MQLLMQMASPRRLYGFLVIELQVLVIGHADNAKD